MDVEVFNHGGSVNDAVEVVGSAKRAGIEIAIHGSSKKEIILGNTVLAVLSAASLFVIGLMAKELPLPSPIKNLVGSEVKFTEEMLEALQQPWPWESSLRSVVNRWEEPVSKNSTARRMVEWWDKPTTKEDLEDVKNYLYGALERLKAEFVVDNGNKPAPRTPESPATKRRTIEMFFAG